MRKKRIVFRIIGNEKVGMGHIYRSLTLAHELPEQQVLFITDTDNEIAKDVIFQQGYWIGVYPPSDVIERIIALRPHLVILDMLDTAKIDVEDLRKAGATVISFEDLGSGARNTDLTVNELYDIPQFEGGSLLWGHKYFFLRDEFNAVKSRHFNMDVDCIMLAFGGTDQHDLSRSVFEEIRSFCKKQKIFVHIVTGPGYRGYQSLSEELKGEAGVAITHASGVISSLMGQIQLAITSNGRTVYEFAHMNVPAIVIAQHEREITHNFASEENGFISLGLYRPNITEQEVKIVLKELVVNHKKRKILYQRLQKYRFDQNKEKIMSRINNLLQMSRDKQPI
jgi:spore coat polysaccharide biosynthesis predicted glycosyltransferase SpsG